jgi:hypothetical protein
LSSSNAAWTVILRGAGAGEGLNVANANVEVGAIDGLKVVSISVGGDEGLEVIGF